VKQRRVAHYTFWHLTGLERVHDGSVVGDIKLGIVQETNFSWKPASTIIIVQELVMFLFHVMYFSVFF
jgi:hypothetical protein